MTLDWYTAPVICFTRQLKNLHARKSTTICYISQAETDILAFFNVLHINKFELCPLVVTLE